MLNRWSLLLVCCWLLWAIVWNQDDSSRSRLSGIGSPAVAQEAVEPRVGRPPFRGLNEPNATATYVGRDVCRECHRENYELHSRHGHAHTFALANDPAVVEKFVGKTYDAGLYGKYVYGADDQGLFVQIPDKFGDQQFPLQYALGSGHLGITLVSLLPHPTKGTVLVEHRASWFSEGDQLALTPGQSDVIPENAVQCFGTIHEGFVMQRCIECHTTTADIVDEQINNLTPSVNCERCHGPGSEHVRQARKSPNPPPFSVGQDDWDTESEIQLCGDCHRLPHAMSHKELRDYEDATLRFQPVGMLRSECFVKSKGQLKCTTCHSPHRSIVETKEADYIQACIDCHQPETQHHVACPVSPSDGCIDCHMPEIDVPGLGGSFHDHWIRVRDDR